MELKDVNFRKIADEAWSVRDKLVADQSSKVAEAMQNAIEEAAQNHNSADKENVKFTVPFAVLPEVGDSLKKHKVKFKIERSSHRGEVTEHTTIWPFYKEPTADDCASYYRD